MIIICYNCGCGIPDDDMGKGIISEGGASLTDKDFEYLAQKWDMDVNDVKKFTFELLKKQVEK